MSKKIAPDKIPAKTGRPSKRCDELADKICELIATSDRGAHAVARELGVSPNFILGWQRDDEIFAAKYAHAKTMQADYMAEQILEISDYSRNDTYIDEHGNTRVDMEIVARSRLRVDSRKWLMAKLAPKVYGDRTIVDVNTTPVVDIDAVEAKIQALTLKAEQGE